MTEPPPEPLSYETARARLAAFRRDDPINVDGVAMTVVRDLYHDDPTASPEAWGLFARVDGVGSFGQFVTIRQLMHHTITVDDNGKRRKR